MKTLISAYNQLDKKIVSRKIIINLLDKAKKLNFEYIIFKLENLLETSNQNNFKIKLKNKIKLDKNEASFGMNGSKQVAYLSKQVVRKLPIEIIKYISKHFNNIYGSPYSSSFYSEDGQTWEYTPKNQIRISDHWNFDSRDYLDPFSKMVTHAVTDIPVQNNTHWTIAKKNSDTGKYDVIMSLPARNIFAKEKNKAIDKLEVKQPNTILNEHLRRIRFKEIQRLDERRKRKIGKSLWIKYDRTYTVRYSARKFGREYENGVVALLMGETASFITVKIGASIQKIKRDTLTSYKEYASKPK